MVKTLIGHLQRFFWSLIWIFTNIFWKSSWMEMKMLLRIGSDIIVALITLSLGDPSNFFIDSCLDWLMMGFIIALWLRKSDHSYRKPQISCLVFNLFKNVSDYFRLRFPTFPQIWSFFPWNYYFLLEMNGLRTNSTANKTAPF